MLVSVFTPVHKTHKFFELCIESICSQTYRDWEWVILDNSPERNIEDFVRDFLDLHYGEVCADWYKERIKVFSSLTENHDIGYLKDVASCLCRGEIICEHDYDDIMRSMGLEALAQAAKQTDCDFFYSDWINVDHLETGEIISRVGAWVVDIDKVKIGDQEIMVNVFALPEVTFDYFKEKIIPLHLRAWRRNFFHLINGFDNSLEIVDDYDILMKSFIYGKICRVSYPAVIINYYGTNTTQNYTVEETHRRADLVFEKYEKELKERYEKGEMKSLRFIPSFCCTMRILE